MTICIFCKSKISFWAEEYRDPSIISGPNAIFCGQACSIKWQNEKDHKAKLRELEKRQSREKKAKLKKLEKEKALRELEKQREKIENQKEKELNKFKKKSLNIHDTALLVKNITNELDLGSTLEILPMLSEDDHINELVDEVNNKLKNKYRKEIKAIYAKRKVDVGSKYYKQILNDDLNRCISFSRNSIMSKLGISLISNALVKERKPVATKKSPKDKQKKLSKNNTRLINKTKSWKEIKR